MNITHVLAVVPVSDLDRATEWYAKLLGKPADNRPMETLADWHLTESGWLQVFRNPDQAGKTSVNLAVNDLHETAAKIRERGIDPGPVEPASAGVRLLPLTDPDGNTVTLIENLR